MQLLATSPSQGPAVLWTEHGLIWQAAGEKLSSQKQSDVWAQTSWELRMAHLFSTHVLDQVHRTFFAQEAESG
jgi:hypothetical protein